MSLKLVHSVDEKMISRREFMKPVRESLYEYGDIELLSRKTGISIAALYNIRNGTTKWPRWMTLQLLLEPLGLELKLSKISKVDRIVDTKDIKYLLSE